jgi:hypothetical protein
LHDGDEADAKRPLQRVRGRAHARQQRRHKRAGGKSPSRGQTSGKGKNSGCTPTSRARTCEGRCGTITNRCGKPVDCGPCTCTTGCPQCQTCNQTTGLCDPVVNGIGCDDGNACTQTDTCQNGVCVGSNPVVCNSPDECQNLPGTCNSANGQCAYPNKATGTTCTTVACGQCDGTGTCASGCNAATQDCFNGSCATRCSDPTTCSSCGGCSQLFGGGPSYCTSGLTGDCCEGDPLTCAPGRVCVNAPCHGNSGHCYALCTPT